MSGCGLLVPPLVTLNMECIQREVEEMICHGKGYLCLFYWVASFFFPERKNLSPQEKRYAMGEVLDRRENELISLKKDKRYVDSLLKLCGKVKDRIKGDILKNYDKPSRGSQG